VRFTRRIARVISNSAASLFRPRCNDGGSNLAIFYESSLFVDHRVDDFGS